MGRKFGKWKSLERYHQQRGRIQFHQRVPMQMITCKFHPSLIIMLYKVSWFILRLQVILLHKLIYFWNKSKVMVKDMTFEQFFFDTG